MFSGISVRAPTELLLREAQGSTDSLSGNVNLAFQPRMPTSFWTDSDRDKIVDVLQGEVAERILNRTSSDYVDVVVALKSRPTAYDAYMFARFGGYVTTEPWESALYGFGGQIPYDRIVDFVASDSNVLLVDKEHVSHASLAYAARQIGARTYVWNNLSLQGDPQTSIAVLDTGIDDSHAAFAPGFDDLNFSSKIVGWNDQINPGTTEPYDDNGHGTHVSGLAAGQGFYSTDEAGNALTTSGVRFDSTYSGGRYFMSAFMVNRTGLIKVSVKWRGTGTSRISSVLLKYGDKNLNPGTSASLWPTRNSSATSAQNTWYNITYNVATTPAGGYDKYHVLLDFVGGSGYTYATIVMSWPYTPPDDGVPAWTGIAPETRLVGVKVMDSTGSGTDTGLLDAIDWVIENRQAYHIVVASMSLGFEGEVETVDIAVRSMVESGITTVVSAGNSGSGGNYVFTPGSIDEVLTVAAMNQFDSVTSYSSQGGVSQSTGQTVKPDVTAPGGSFYAVPLYSADTNDNEAEGGFSEYQFDDSASMQGTSMSAPIVSGAVSVVIQALGGYASWQYTRGQALLPKMFLLMTATETYNNKREIGTASNSPVLDRGGKDAHEGYGRLNVDVAVDAVLKSYQVGTIATGVLGRPPVISDISRLGQRLAWARSVQLTSGVHYEFTLNVPVGADFDLYLYNGTGTYYGEPFVVQKSTTVATGGLEEIVIDSIPHSGTYYLVVKRARSDTGGGEFTLQSAVVPSHEITALAVDVQPTVVYPVDPVNVRVTVKNNGLSVESFDVTAYYNATVFGVQGVVGLLPGGVVVLNFTWDTVGVVPGYYVVSAVADSVPGEYDSGDNSVVFPGAVVVKVPGDVNSDDVVDGADLGLLRAAYSSTVLSVNWSSECDFNRDGQVDVYDVRVLGKNFGREI